MYQSPLVAALEELGESCRVAAKWPDSCVWVCCKDFLTGHPKGPRGRVSTDDSRQGALFAATLNPLIERFGCELLKGRIWYFPANAVRRKKKNGEKRPPAAVVMPRFFRMWTMFPIRLVVFKW